MPHDDWEVSPSDIVVDEMLGEGAFGEVYKGFLKEPITCSKVKPSYRNAAHLTVAIKLLKGQKLSWNLDATTIIWPCTSFNRLTLR